MKSLGTWQKRKFTATTNAKNLKNPAQAKFLPPIRADFFTLAHSLHLSAFGGSQRSGGTR